MYVDGQFRLAKDMEEICYQGTHFYIMVLVSIPGLLLWAVGIPIFALIKLKTNMKEMEEIKSHIKGKNNSEDLMKSFKIRLGFLRSGYEDKFYFWEIVLLMRKTVVVLLIVFLSSVSSGL